MVLTTIAKGVAKHIIETKQVDVVSASSGISRASIYSIASKDCVNVTLSTFEKLLLSQNHPLIEDIQKYSNAA